MNAYMISAPGKDDVVVLARSVSEAREIAKKPEAYARVYYLGEVLPASIAEVEHAAVKRLTCAGCEGCKYDLANDDRRL